MVELYENRVGTGIYVHLGVCGVGGGWVGGVGMGGHRGVGMLVRGRRGWWRGDMRFHMRLM